MVSRKSCRDDSDSNKAAVFGGIYRFDATQQALAFFGILVGAVFSVLAYILWLYFVYQPRAADPKTVVQPEDRLRPGQVGAVCIPICLFVFAWTSRERYLPNIFPNDYTNQLIRITFQRPLDRPHYWFRILCSRVLPHFPVHSQLPWRIVP